MSDLKFKIEGEAQTPARLAASARQFIIVVDEPPALGGDDQGANPVEYLLASYAGCINVVAHLTARELGIKLSGLKIQVEGNLNPARLFGKSDDERAGFKQINVQFLPETDASQEEIENWIATIKNRCPINDNLANPTPLAFNFAKELITT
ncbi:MULTISPECIES: OsmC family protein [Draconibacterium]|uniref:Osmotically inducible protein C n=1 Tax=Draconibacterium sediminis TaxID=1544798 RepID=A0A0D8J9T0_9BACT|nr:MULTISPECIES: OsmC family protein [Draconibacterium]KJF43672.1 osmotically inducible protein C [Draconibacterium sediminis]